MLGGVCSHCKKPLIILFKTKELEYYGCEGCNAVYEKTVRKFTGELLGFRETVISLIDFRKRNKKEIEDFIKQTREEEKNA